MRSIKSQAARLAREGIDTKVVDDKLMIEITKEEWKDYHEVQNRGTMNMMMHYNVLKFMPGDNWLQAYEHFEDGGCEETITLPAPS